MVRGIVMSLYNLKSVDGNWRITKFTNDLDVESSYITSETTCECPAGVRPSCRHRQMLPRMLNVGAEDSGMFYDFERDVFLEPIEGEDTQPVIVSPITEDFKIVEYTGTNVATEDEVVSAANESYISPPTPIAPSSAHPSISGPLKRRI